MNKLVNKTAVLLSFSFLITMVFIILVQCNNVPAQKSDSPSGVMTGEMMNWSESRGFKYFVKRKKDKLYDGKKEYRFISVNVPNFHIVEDPASGSSPRWHRITEFEQRDILKTVSLLGGQVLRMYTFSIVGGKNNSDELSHIMGIDPSTDTLIFNEELFKDLDRVIDTGLSGAHIWSLRFHFETGGFYFHRDFGNSDSFHYPGFPKGDPDDEDKILTALRSRAYKIRGLEAPPHPAPEVPPLLPIHNPLEINWQGSAGAVSYDIKRALSAEGPWELIGKDIIDVQRDSRDIPVLPLFSDTTAKPDTRYFYRICAKNSAGVSPYTRIVELSTSS